MASSNSNDCRVERHPHGTGSTVSLRSRFASLMEDVAEKDSNLVVIVSDISHGLFRPFASRFPDRYFNMGICEPSIVNLSAGLNHVGLNPVVHTIAPFLVERCFEQLKLDFGYQKKSVNLVSVGGAFDYSKLGCSHHSYADVALVSQIPGSFVFMPGSTQEFEGLFRAAYAQTGIKYFRLTENPHEIQLPGWSGAIGTGVRVAAGDDVTLAVVGAQLKNGWEAANVLGSAGIGSDLLYFPTIKPFDADLLRESIQRTRAVLTVEELSNRDGLFARACEVSVGLADVRLSQLAIPEFIHGYGTYSDLCSRAGLDVKTIVSRVQSLVAS